VHLSLRTALGASSSYVAQVSGDAAPQLIGQVHHSRFEDLGITPEVVHWKGKDGLPIAGILYKPVDYKRAPAILRSFLPTEAPRARSRSALRSGRFSLRTRVTSYLNLTFAVALAMANTSVTPMSRTLGVARSTTWLQE
jgi:dipeptidyl aminopeptidase/acylaminoacyl peptidase